MIKLISKLYDNETSYHVKHWMWW